MFGLAVVLLGLGTFGAWASIAKLSSAIIGSGIVKVYSNRKIVQSPEIGTIRAIQVENGQKVTKGDVLIELDKTKSRAFMDIAQERYDLARATVARLRSERERTDSIVFPESLLNRRNDASVASIIQTQEQLFDARRNALSGQIQVIRQQKRQLNEQINGISAQSAAVSDRISITKEELEKVKELVDQNLVSKSRTLKLGRELAELTGEKGSLEAQIAAAEAQIAQAELQILQLSMSFEEDINDELGKQESQMFVFAQQILDARHTLEQKVIRATEDGVVVGLEVHTLGGVVEPGETLLEIVPLKDELVIETQINPMDIDSVFKGLEANVVFTGFSQRELPRMVGTVNYVSADALTNQRTGAPYFTVHVSIPKSELQKFGDHKLVPGMPAEVFVRTGEHTPLAYLTQPLRESFRRAWREP
ncbi:MAG: HlyD family type I secretion periplasmic adaptor subunit [Pseudomonadota bacterium]